MGANRISMKLSEWPTLLKFDSQLPIYNWLYPFDKEENRVKDPLSVFSRVKQDSGRRAIYVHVPFCDTICSFCPFVRGEYESEDEVDRYVRALLKEFEIKHQYEGIRSTPVDTIYFGGGTPSVLKAEHFYQIGEALHTYFDLSQLKEFTIECEVKSVTLEKLKAWQDIGVNRTSFGVQTFSPFYRQLFNMTATVERIREVSAWVNERFFTNVDMIYGMAGQSLDDFLNDVDQVNELGMSTVDFYLLNNVVSQLRLHRGFETHGLQPLSANTKLSYRMFLNEYMRAQGYIPNSSYSFTKNTSAPASGAERVIVQREPSFLYHKLAYGFANDFVDGYGAGSHSQMGEHLIMNIGNREQYMARLLNQSQQAWFTAFEGLDVGSKGVIHFPYVGTLEKARIKWEDVHPQTREAFEESLKQGMATDRGDYYELTDTGWLFAVNYMYYLMPPEDQDILSDFIHRQGTPKDRKPDDLVFLPPLRKRAVASV